MVQNPRRYPAVVNNSLENQHDFCRLKAASGENSYNDLVKDNLIFDSIANFDRNTKLKINNSIQRRQARFRNFPDTTLGEFLDYTDPPLVEETMTQLWYTLVSAILLMMIARQK